MKLYIVVVLTADYSPLLKERSDILRGDFTLYSLPFLWSFAEYVPVHQFDGKTIEVLLQKIKKLVPGLQGGTRGRYLE